MKRKRVRRPTAAAKRVKPRQYGPAANGLNFEDFATGWPFRPDEVETDDDALPGLADRRAADLS